MKTTSLVWLGRVLLAAAVIAPWSDARFRAANAAGRSDVRRFQTQFSAASGGLAGLRRSDAAAVEFLARGKELGEVVLRSRSGAEPWRESSAAASADVRRVESIEGPGRAGRRMVFQGPSKNAGGLPSVRLVQSFDVRDDELNWSITLTNTGAAPLEIGDVALPLPMNTEYVWDHDETFARRVFKHAYIAGHGSFLYWLPVQGTGPILVLQPRPDTSLEFFTAADMDYAFGRERFSVYVHSKASAELERRGSWRQAHTSRTLAPREEASYGFTFRWADSYAQVRELLYGHGGFDVRVAPGMVVPRDLAATIALRTKRAIDRIEPEFPGDTRVEALPGRRADAALYRIRLSRLGENRLTVRCRDGAAVPLEFFVTEPLETLVKKRAAFIVRRQQHRDPAKWYDGLFSLWDRRQPQGRNLLGPDHLGGQPPYAVSGSDDPSNGKCLLLAEKNVAFPDAAEIEALEYFVERFVWGKQQRTDRETPYPFGIYGADSWRENRFTARDSLEQGVSRPGGPSACRMWRTFDYPTYFALYFNLYRIARQRPDLVKRLDADGYLQRAFGTARAYFEVPAAIRMEGGWSFTGWVYWQYTVGNFHEKYLLPLIAALEAEGRRDQADLLRRHWERKVKYFIYDHRWPFASEMPIDSTAYESTYAAARYAMEAGLVPDKDLWRDRNRNATYSHSAIDPARHREFLVRQHAANLACRGVLETNYWSLGSDFRGCGSASYTLSYMSQLGGWSVLDYALRFDPQPADNLRLGYASLLSSWALVNSGDAASNYGYWTPGPLHDGAMSWGFQPRQVGTEWNPATRDLPRGAWPVCGEADHGLVAGIEAAATVVDDDPLFGVIAYGGEVSCDGQRLSIVPRDGVRQRLSVLLAGGRLHLRLDRDGLAAGQPIVVAASLNRLAFTLESRAPQPHKATLTLEGLPTGRYTLVCGVSRSDFRAEPAKACRVDLVVRGAAATPVRIEPQRL